MSENDLTLLEGCLERVTYENPANGYTVAKFRAAGFNHLMTVTGYLGGLRPGEAAASRPLGNPSAFRRAIPGAAS